VGYEGHARARYYVTDDDYRGPFGRDRDRILYSSAFRRLAGKTQVVAVGELGDFHTRMTHTLKVAQLGRRISQRLQQMAADQEIGRGSEFPAPDPELVEAACLAHDLGHPPFGHAGESALTEAVTEMYLQQRCADPDDPTEQERLAAHDFGGFEGNAQTFRLLTRLSARQPRHTQGLDLTRATLDATVKYPWVRGKQGKPARKWNAYPDDLPMLEWVREGGPSVAEGSPISLEAQIMDWCDDVTYACHDVEDFYRAGLIPLEQILAFLPRRPTNNVREEPPEAAGFLDFVERKWTGDGRAFDRDAALDALRAISHRVFLDSPYRGDRESKVAIHRATSALITFFVDSTSWTPPEVEPTEYQARLQIAPDARFQCDLLQELNWYYVIMRPALASQQYGQQTVVRELLSIYCENTDLRLWPDDRKEELEGTDQVRVATDHVASLTEPSALALYHRLTGVRIGSHAERVWRA